jgi:glycosyltransferase involved in cell wall biosynthesis
VRVLVVSAYPPRRCGIGAYASAQVERLRSEGHDVTVLSPPDGHGDIRVPFTAGRPFRIASRVGRKYERIVVQFQPLIYYAPRAPVSKVVTSLSLLWLCLRRRQTELVVHEADQPKLWRPDYLLLAATFRAAPLLLFHTAREREQLERSYGVRVRARLVDHREGVGVHARPTREEARTRLGLPRGEPVFVTPGFIHPDKGLERAVAALGDAGRLYLVGSVKDRTPRNLAYLDRVRVLATQTPGVELVEDYLDDGDLDAWIAAADALVLPYRRSWSSGVLARAQALGTRAIVTAVGGLPEQATGADVVVEDEEGLSAAMAAIAAERRGAEAARR